MSYDVAIADFDVSQLADLKALFASYFPPGDRLLTDAYSHWLYAGSPFGRALMVTVTEDGSWVGFMAMIPVELVKHDARMRAYYVVNVLVHPKHHGKNLFGRMITAAKERVTAENSALMGHPNDMALKSWQRAKMHFHQALIPSVRVPTLWPLHMKVRGVQSKDDLVALGPVMTQLVTTSPRWNVSVSAELLAWRYLQHPTNRYRVQLIEVDGAAVGVQISKRMRPGLYALTDQFVADEHADAATALLPWFAVVLRSESVTNSQRGLAFRLPVKKQLPFFCTHLGEKMNTDDLTGLGLTASDF
jgi:GNAT superfamily N-acetyltransferase